MEARIKSGRPAGQGSRFSRGFPDTLCVYRLEMKKLLSQKALWLTALIGLALLATMEASNLLFLSFRYPDGREMSARSYYALARQKGAELAGQEMDDVFWDHVRGEVIGYAVQAGYLTEAELNEIKAGTASELTIRVADAALRDAAEECGLSDVFMWLRNLSEDLQQALTADAQAITARLDQQTERVYSAEEATEEEREYWLAQYAAIQKPLSYTYTMGHRFFLEQQYAFVWLLLILLTVALAGLFAEERNTKMDALILSAKNGREIMAKAKLMAGFTVSVCASLLLVGVNVAASLGLYGARGGEGLLQLIQPGTAWRLTLRQVMVWSLFLFLLLGIFLSSLVMFLSQLLSGTQTTALMMAFFLVSFFNLPDSWGMAAKLWGLRPNVLLHYSSFYRSSLFFGRLNMFQMSVVLYGVLTVALALVTARLYQRSQVKSR